MANNQQQSQSTLTQLVTLFHRWVIGFFILIIKSYRLLLSPWIGNQCRFQPTCSHYAEMALKEHGAIKGAYLTLRRLLKCHPWHAGGYDPIPEKPAKKTTHSTHKQWQH